MTDKLQCRDLTKAKAIMDKHLGPRPKIDTDKVCAETLMERFKMAQVDMIRVYYDGFKGREKRRADRTMAELNAGLSDRWNISFNLNTGNFKA